MACNKAIFLYSLKNITLLGVADIIDWNELIQSKKSVMALDKHFCGNVIAQYDDNIIIIEGAIIKSHEYIVPKSKVDHYDENNLYLNITRDDMILNFDF